MPAQPEGVVTMLFSDIEGSTALLHAIGPERYLRALERHRELLRSAFAAHAGFEVSFQGDASYFTFGAAGDGVAAAREAQRALAEEPWTDAPIRVRMGIHTGTPLVTGPDYVGFDVHKAARIMAAGHGGQTLVSAATRALLPDDADVRDLGEHRLKDLLEPERIFQLGGTDFPPIRTLAGKATSLPIQPTPFVGRGAELEELAGLLRDAGRVRLLSLVGPGATGKTRLALQAAADAADAFEGVYFVPLAHVRDTDLVLPAVADALSVTVASDETPLDAVASAVGHRRLLLLLDNLEQLLDAAPQIEALVEVCTKLTVVTTTRERLRVSAEHVFPVPPLVPDEAVALFAERARAAAGAFALDEQTADAVRAICVRLDGLPLAIELAAARSAVLSPSAILRRLDRRFELLSDGGRDKDARQQTLRGAIAWSYELLDEEERGAFTGLAAFAGGCTLEAAETVIRPAGDSFRLLASLVEKNLVRQSPTADGEPRFSMLETIREYASELLDAGDPTSVRERHASYYAALVDAQDARRKSGDQAAGLAVLEAEQANVRIAIESALAVGDIDCAARLGSGMAWFWYVRGRFREGQAWLERIETAGAASDEIRAQLLNRLGVIVDALGDTEASLRALEESLVLRRRLGDAVKLGATLNNLALTYSHLDRLDDAETLYDEYRGLFREAGLTDPSTAISGLAFIARRRGDAERAAALFEQASELSRGEGDPRSLGVSLVNVGGAFAELGRTEDAWGCCSEAFEIFEELQDPVGIALTLVNVARVLAGGPRPEDGAMLLASARGALQELGVGLAPTDLQQIGELELRLAELLPAPELADAVRAGEALSLDDAVTRARAVVPAEAALK